MFGCLFGWRKASKCKKLIKTVQCRLKLLKNKRGCIVKQLREDVAELLKHGLDQIAFQRVEQLIKDERTVEVYDLLDRFCEFIMMNIPYIRKHKDCPNDINEAASTLIFSSARFGELPELLSIRKLFGERYGQRFITAALELLPGNLVNHQIKENVYMKSVPDDVKYRLLDEIASSCIQPGPLLLEYKPELKEEQAISGANKVSSGKVLINNDNEAPELQLCIGRETEGQIIYMDLSSEDKKFSDKPCFELRKEQICLNAIQDLDPGEVQKLIEPTDCSEMDRFTVSHTAGMAVESSSETSAQLPEEMIYLDDIEEFESPVSKDGILQDQRLFMFKSFGIPIDKKTDNGIDVNLEEQKIFQEKSVPRSSRKMRKTSRKRSRRRSVSQEDRNIADTECVTYYAESDETSPDNKRKFYYQRERRDKILVQERQKSYGVRRNQGNSSLSLIKGTDNNLELSCRCNSTAKKCSLGYPCYLRSSDENEAPQSPCWITKSKSSKLQDIAMQNLKEGKVQYGLYFCKHSHKGEPEEKRTGQESQPPSLRAMTMPAERPKQSPTDNIFRSNSFPFEQPHRGHSSFRHIHPKLPDYDELAAKFMELKRANLQSKQQS